jgi:hypothetical protein
LLKLNWYHAKQMKSLSQRMTEYRVPFNALTFTLASFNPEVFEDITSLLENYSKELGFTALATPSVVNIVLPSKVLNMQKIWELIKNIQDIAEMKAFLIFNIPQNEAINFFIRGSNYNKNQVPESFEDSDLVKIFITGVLIKPLESQEMEVFDGSNFA